MQHSATWEQRTRRGLAGVRIGDGARHIGRRVAAPLAVVLVLAGALGLVGMFAVTIAVVALAVLADVVRSRLLADRALQRLAGCVRTLPDAATLRRAVADAFDDPTVEILFPSGGGWMDDSGRHTTLPGPRSGRCVSEVRDGETRIAAIVYEKALREQRPHFVAAAVAMAGLVLDNQRLIAEAATSTCELQLSRARIATSAERERRRIERDLHDGAQQRLVALRIEMGLAEELIRNDPERGAERMQALGGQVEAALDELRALASGVYPPLLADRGLAEALGAVAGRFGMPVALRVRAVGRYRPEVESAVYFCVLEAMQNVLKHAPGARRAIVRLDGEGADLRFSVSDDGPGISGAIRAGAGMTNMRDRLESIGGEVDITSTPGAGTVVRGRVPSPHGA